MNWGWASAPGMGLQQLLQPRRMGARLSWQRSPILKKGSPGGLTRSRSQTLSLKPSREGEGGDLFPCRSAPFLMK